VTELAEHPPTLPPPLEGIRSDSSADLHNARKRLPRKKFVDDMPDKGLFLFVAAFGFCGILWLKSQGGDTETSGRSSDAIAAGAVLLMLIYGYIAFRIPEVRLRADRLGDNFYYLGFIFTLASLSAALIQFRGGVRVHDLLGSFGIALVTTIVGIAGRVVFLQMRSEIDDVEEAVRRDLATTAADLRAQLGETIREFETFRTALLQTVHETQQQLAMSAKSHVEAVDAVTSANRNHASSLNESMKSIAQSVKTASERAEKISIPNERLNSQLGEFATGLESLLKRLTGIIEEVALRANRRRISWFFGSRS
jgi:methyl-accepting chemotaxis protein